MGMFGVINNLQVLDPVILPVSILVMDSLGGSKQPAEMSRHYKPMLRHRIRSSPAAHADEWVIRCHNHADIPLFRGCPATLPRRCPWPIIAAAERSATLLPSARETSVTLWLTIIQPYPSFS